MNFNEEQSKKIYEFMMKYNSEEEFRDNAQKLYDEEISKLSILHIYAMEEVLRYGTRGVFGKFVESKGTNSLEQAVDLFDGFMNLLDNDQNFKQYKMDQLKATPELISTLEMLAFQLISTTKSQGEKMYEEVHDGLDYDEFNQILYSTDFQIRQTLENLFFGELIHKMLELPGMKSVKARQKESGRIANVDKPLIIEKIKEVALEENAMIQFRQAINNRYPKVKMDLLFGKGIEAFAPYLKYNTNISSSEILGAEKNVSFNDFYNYFVDMFNKQKNDRGPRK